MSSLADRFRAARLRAGLTQVALARAAGCDPSTVSRIERGEVQPTDVVSSNIARVCKCEVGELRGELELRA